MFRILWNSKSAMNANQEKLDSISNNLANVNTTGYKRVDTQFKDLLSESFDRLGYPVNDKDAYTGTGVRTSEWLRDKTQGTMLETGIPTDMAIDGKGYFRIQAPTGEVSYTRAGAFNIDSLGRLVDSNGNKLYVEYANGYSEGNPKLDSKNLVVNQDGSILQKNGGKFDKIGTIPLYNAVGDDSMVSIGENLYSPKPGVNMFKETDADINQGYLEGSNVDMAKEFSDMIITQRAFQLASKGVTTADEMWGMVNNMRGK
ncbi:flagellar basal-body rod protein FlgG [Clostridium sp. 'White wine YQ']|uniref:flagellar basal-body rod protein FlgG n=1 Tax=Clostridium sp. 'White wine YQ' TaxID=3027474 RepID=UPI0023660F76|nr:flagellar basal-body rod protein FlgG [Clostridium sp. 'White wine YQ']MDD7794578.1 flagellar hook-basal body complex protein [Clostridium sp. 'White wine YQ']